MTRDADAAREHSRAANGQFGTQVHPEAALELSHPVTDPAEGEPWSDGDWDGMVFAMKARRSAPEFCLLELQDAARDMGRQEVFDRHAYRTGNPVEDFDRIVAELAAGRRGRHLLTGEPLPAQTVAAVAASLQHESIRPDAPEEVVAAQLAAAAVDTGHETSRNSMATHMEVTWGASRRGARYAAGSVCEAFGIPDHRTGFAR